MPTVDLGSVTLSVDENRVEAAFPFEHGELRSVAKKMRGHFFDERKTWVVYPKTAGLTEEQVVETFEKSLWANAPKGWREAVNKFEAFACVSKKYGIKFGAGGLRIELPQGHVCNWTLHEMMQRKGKQPRENIWHIPARDANSNIVMPIIKRIAEEDEAVFDDATKHYVGRTTKGTLHLKPEEADELGLTVGNIVFADYSFVKAADPTIVSMPIHSWPYLVTARTDTPGAGHDDLKYGVEVTLTYPEVKQGFKALRKMIAKKGEGYPRRLDSPDVLIKWLSRNRK